MSVNGKVILSWEPVEGVSYYEVKRKPCTLNAAYQRNATVNTSYSFSEGNYVYNVLYTLNGLTYLNVGGPVSYVDGELFEGDRSSEFVPEGSTGSVGNLTATIGATSTLVSWTPVSGAIQYIVIYKLSTASTSLNLSTSTNAIQIPYGGTSSFTVTVQALVSSSLIQVGTLTVTNGVIIGADGTPEEPPADPIAVSSKEDLNNVRNNLAASYYLTNDIVFTSEDFAEGGDFYNSGYGFLPIGMGSGAFSGTFDGNGYTISGLQMNLSSAASGLNGGLFASNFGTVKNLTVSGNIAAIGSSNNMGLICGTNSGIISNCYNSGSIIATTDNNLWDLYVG